MPEPKSKKPRQIQNPLKSSLELLIERVKHDAVTYQNFAIYIELFQQLAEIKDRDNLIDILKAINNLKIIPEIKFYNLLLKKMGDLNEWTQSKKLFNFLDKYQLADKTSFSIMFDIAADHRPLNFVTQVYMGACDANFADIIMHNRMLNLVEEAKDIDLARLVFRNTFEMPGSVKNNFAKTTLMHDAHAKMLAVAVELDDIILAWQVYNHALINTKPNVTLHKKMIDFLLEKEFYLEAITIYQNYNFELIKENKRDATEINLTGQSFGTAYLGVLQLLSDVTAPITIKIVEAPDVAKQLLKFIEKNFYSKISELKVDYSDPKHYGFHFKPHKLRADARSFFPSKEPDKIHEETKEHSPKVTRKNSR